MENKSINNKLLAAILIIGCLMFGNFVSAQKTKIVYYYATAVLKDKKIGVTPVLSSEIGQYNYASTCKAQLQTYLQDYIPAETDYEIDYGRNSSVAVMGGTGSTNSDANKYRLQDIKKYKDLGYQIVHLNSLSFTCDQ